MTSIQEADILSIKTFVILQRKIPIYRVILEKKIKLQHRMFETYHEKKYCLWHIKLSKCPRVFSSVCLLDKSFTVAFCYLKYWSTANLASDTKFKVNTVSERHFMINRDYLETLVIKWVQSFLLWFHLG